MKFNIYTYQFERIIRHNYDLFNQDSYHTLTDDEWAKRQDIFASVLLGLKNITFKDEAGNEYNHKEEWNNKSVFVFRLANEKQTKVDTVDFEEKDMPTYPPVYVIIDNRDGVQRLFIQKRPKAWLNTDTPAEIIRNTFDTILTPKGMHFSIGDGPVYPTQSFWQFVNSAQKGISRVRFKFPPINLARLHNLAGSIDAIRDETGAGYTADIKATKDGIVLLREDNPHTASLVNLSAASGTEIDIWKKGQTKRYVIGGENNEKILEIKDRLIQFINVKDLNGIIPTEELLRLLNEIE
ncbi:MAG: hypothetical protein ACI4AW_01925 [Paludibacteraceae bacterium]